MTSVHYPPPQPWESAGGHNPDLAQLLAATWRQRSRLAAWYPWVPVTAATVASPFTGGWGAFRVGAMVLLWSRWDYTRGACPECRGEGIGFTFAGGLSLAYVTGVCLSCGLVVHRTAHRLGAVVSGIRQALQGTPYPVSGSQTRAHSPPVALIASLAELGETGLPDPRATGLAPPYVRCSNPQEDTTNAGHAHDILEETPFVPRPRAPKTRDRHPERLTRDGAVLLSHNHISLLQGLLDRPRGRAESKRDLIAAAQPYVRRYRGSPPSWWTMNLATYTLHPSWVNWRRKGGRLIYRLLARGREILDGKVPARIIGVGRFVPGSTSAGESSA
jgi:hypothetical protein